MLFVTAMALKFTDLNSGQINGKLNLQEKEKKEEGSPNQQLHTKVMFSLSIAAAVVFDSYDLGLMIAIAEVFLTLRYSES